MAPRGYHLHLVTFAHPQPPAWSSFLSKGSCFPLNCLNLEKQNALPTQQTSKSVQNRMFKKWTFIRLCCDNLLFFTGGIAVVLGFLSFFLLTRDVICRFRHGLNHRWFGRRGFWRQDVPAEGRKLGSMVIGSNGSYNLWGINWGYKPMVSRSIHGYNS